MFRLLVFVYILTVSPALGIICYTCFGNSTDSGSFCSIDKLCTGTSCYFNYNSDESWSAGCSTDLVSNTNITCSTSGSTCSCNSDFCNSMKKMQAVLANVTTTSTWNVWNKKGQTSTTTVSLVLPNRTLVYCEECGSVTVGNETVDIPCDHDHTCLGNYCVSVRGQAPYSYCGGVWDEERESACYHNATTTSIEPERCYCTMNMCNFLLDPAPIYTTTVSALADATLASLILVNDSVETLAETTTTASKTTTKKKCSSSKLSPNDQALTAGEKLKNVILSGFGTEDDTLDDNNCTDDEE